VLRLATAKPDQDDRPGEISARASEDQVAGGF
jgi:hypothetical protein